MESLNPWHRIQLMEYISVGTLLYRRSRPELVAALHLDLLFHVSYNDTRFSAVGLFCLGKALVRKHRNLTAILSIWFLFSLLGLVYTAPNNSGQSSYFNLIRGLWLIVLYLFCTLTCCRLGSMAFSGCVPDHPLRLTLNTSTYIKTSVIWMNLPFL